MAHGAGSVPAASGAPAAAPKVETAAEKLAKLRAKQAERAGGAYLSGRVGSDYEAGAVVEASTKGLARYQALVKGGSALGSARPPKHSAEI